MNTPLAAWIGALLCAHLSAPSAQTIYKCVTKDGKIAYSSIPCPGAGKPMPPAATRSLTAETMTLSQADVAFDCLEALEHRTKPRWRSKEQERSAFDRYCPASGFRAPMGPGTDDFNRRHGEALLRRLRERFGELPSMSRAYTDTHRTPPLFEDAEAAMQGGPVAASGRVASLPEVKFGRWRIVATGNDRGTAREICGDPLQSVRELLQSPEFEALGCSIRTSSSAPGTSTWVMDCPADRSRDGHVAQSGRRKLTIEAHSRQSLRMTMVGPGVHQSGEASWLSDCR
ncbi:MAG: DUF4124 domain-containing protein [Elioraea sp.]|nr:DUF4124 domain-containing protein [Elioraea sp.]